MVTDVKELTVESSPSEILASMSPADHKKWRETGATPELKEKAAAPAEEKKADQTETAESSPAAKTETVEKPAESTPAKVEPSKSRGKNAETRIPELLSEIKRLNAELDAARKVPVPASAKIEEIAKPRRNDVDEKTGLAKYASDEAFEAAYETYLTNKVTKDVETRHAKAQQEARIADQNRILQEKWVNSLKVAHEAHPDFAKICEIDDKGAFQNAELKKIKSSSALDRFILDTPRGGDVLYYLASHPGEVERIQKIESLDEITEALVELKKNSLASVQAPKLEEKEGSKPKVTGAPAPATSISGKATAPVDEEVAAVESGDFRRFRKAANEAEWKAKKKAS